MTEDDALKRGSKLSRVTLNRQGGTKRE